MASQDPNVGYFTMTLELFTSKINEIKANGGPWHLPAASGKIAAHQLMGGYSDLIAFTGTIQSGISIPADVINGYTMMN